MNKKKKITDYNFCFFFGFQLRTGDSGEVVNEGVDNKTSIYRLHEFQIRFLKNNNLKLTVIRKPRVKYTRVELWAIAQATARISGRHVLWTVGWVKRVKVRLFGTVESNCRSTRGAIILAVRRMGSRGLGVWEL